MRQREFAAHQHAACPILPFACSQAGHTVQAARSSSASVTLWSRRQLRFMKTAPHCSHAVGSRSRPCRTSPECALRSLVPLRLRLRINPFPFCSAPFVVGRFVPPVVGDLAMSRAVAGYVPARDASGIHGAVRSGSRSAGGLAQGLRTRCFSPLGRPWRQERESGRRAAMTTTRRVVILRRRGARLPQLQRGLPRRCGRGGGRLHRHADSRHRGRRYPPALAGALLPRRHSRSCPRPSWRRSSGATGVDRWSSPTAT